MIAMFNPANRRFLYPGLSVGLLFPLLMRFYWPDGGGLDVTGQAIGRDFINVWVGPQLAFDGRLATLFDLAGYQAAIGELFGHAMPFHNWGYPLFTLPMFWPLAQLPYFLALTVWTVGLFVPFAGVTLSQIKPQDRVRAVLMLAIAPACLINAVGGQNGFLSAALLLGGILALERRPVLAGMLFGLLTFKPHLGIVLPFALIALGAWRVIASATVTALGLLALSVAIFGIEPWRQYVDVAGAYQVDLLEHFYGYYAFMMTSITAGARTLGVPYRVALAIQVIAAVFVLVASCWAVRRTADPCRRAFVLACAAPLVTPYAFNYDLTAVAAVLVWILFGRLPWRSRWGDLYLLAWLVPVGAMYLNMLGLGVAPLVQIALFGLSLREAVTSPEAAGTTGKASGQGPDSAAQGSFAVDPLATAR
ncbi:MAG TPA: glycosyltransferase family 87 protein [Xanthobacteraceae bacterium]